MLIILSPTNRGWAMHRYILWFGANSPTCIMVWANNLEAALDKAVDYLADYAPGLLVDEAVQEMYKHAIKAGKSEEEAQAIAEIDTIQAGNNGHYLNAWGWGILTKDPPRATVKAIVDDCSGSRLGA
jgi:hypothetical protein